ncbi:MAG: hypothetical protein NW202_14470 [Nitrospira sp.]|nr:hypothetical protein [Nitrospira sp.]
MWIEDKSNGLVGPARIGWVEIKNRGKKLIYKDKIFLSLRGGGFKANFYETATRDEYWISGCSRDGRDALYNTNVEIDGDAAEEYWVRIRNSPEKVGILKLRVQGKH